MGRVRVLVLGIITLLVIYEFYFVYKPAPPFRLPPAPSQQPAPAAAPSNEPPPIQIIPITPDSK
ncbi:MAG TPA: hypothetical protein VEU06_11705 [Micropepsaceae bacterium]|nr:hypothetical protein [Micropepsaceae bacterium]